MSSRAPRNFRWFVREDLRRWPGDPPPNGSGWRVESNKDNPFRVRYRDLIVGSYVGGEGV